MSRLLTMGMAALPVAAALGCGSKVMVPPRIDLRQHEVLAIIEFSSSSEGELGPLATREFMQAARRDQGLIRIIQLGSEQEALSDVGSERLDPATYKALGRQHAVSTIFLGELVVSDVRPAISIAPDLRDLSFAADVDATLAVQMVETAT
jgi:hypothetical protein